MALRKHKIDPFAEISEKEVLWQEIPIAAKDAVKGEDKTSYTWQGSRNYSAVEVKKAWANRKASKKIGPTRKEL